MNVISPEAASLAARLEPLGAPDWLCEGYAFDIPLQTHVKAACLFARNAAQGMAVDINLIPRANRRKKLLAADMESTIIACECVDELAAIAGVGQRVAALTERVMRGEIAFAPALHERVALLKGLPLSALQRVYDERVRFNPGAKALVATMKAHGAMIMLLSGGFTWFTERVAREAGFDVNSANVLLDDGEKLLGTVKEPVLDREAKVQALESAAAARGIPLSETTAVGDGANDVGMVKRAGLGVAWHAKPILAEAAAIRIDHADLTALLYLQGYRRSEIVSA
ncbi:MAG TPA: phosphoserine phosphatase SerB [Rhizomicrobium sp.]|nr:phosphoserine phosphatase SerB [Rhizomicrobium sp.]